ncbi:MAG: glutamine synthetase, partial [Gordonia sp. (in: high G+C Gram-positive bacteria)]
GVENREATLRYVAAGPLLGPGYANVELKSSDAAGNPYLVIASVISAGLDGIRRELVLPEPVDVEPSTLSASTREAKGISLLPTNIAEGLKALNSNDAVREAIWPETLEAYTALRESEASWAQGKTPEEIIAGQLWRY